MASKKYSFLAGVLSLLASYSFAQQTTTTTTSAAGYDVADSSVVPSRRMPQYTEFMNGTYNFPAKPRNMWEIGVKGGIVDIFGDVPSTPNIGGGIHIRKALGYLFSLRLEYMQGVAKGLSWQRTTNYYNDPAWADRYQAGTDPIFYNYRTELKDLSLEGIFNLTNIRFHKASTGVNAYVFGGLGGLIYTAYVNALNDKGAAVTNPFDPTLRYTQFNTIPQGTWKTRKDVRSALKNMMDDTYETRADNQDATRPTLLGHSFRPVGHIGAGLAFKLNRRFNLAVEDRFSIVGDDLLDGKRWAEQTSGQPVLTSSNDTYNYLTVGLNYNIGSKAVEPLWWVNPLDYAYQEIRKPRLMILPKPVLPDSDGDGVTDQFDQEQTPQGCPVDAHGVSLDTDGDGVPDCRDKEKVTPTICQPVDADGVGKCPCPDSSCGYGRMGMSACAANLGALPSVTFSGNGYTLNNDSKGLLASVAARMRNSPECKVVVTGYCASSKAEQQRSWDRVNAVINYLVEKEGISQDRFFWQYGQSGGDCNTVDLRAATDADLTLPTTVPAPHPNLSRHHK